MSDELLRINLVVLLVLLLLLDLHGLLLRLHVLLLLLLVHLLGIHVVFGPCPLLFVRVHDETVLIRAAWVHLPSIHVSDHLGWRLGMSLDVLVSCNKLLRLVGLLPVTELARGLRNDDVLDVVVDRQIDGWLLHFDLFCSTHNLGLFLSRSHLGWVLWTRNLAIDKSTNLGRLVDCAVREVSWRVVVVVLRLSRWMEVLR